MAADSDPGKSTQKADDAGQGKASKEKVPSPENVREATQRVAEQLARALEPPVVPPDLQRLRDKAEEQLNESSDASASPTQEQLRKDDKSQTDVELGTPDWAE